MHSIKLTVDIHTQIYADIYIYQKTLTSISHEPRINNDACITERWLKNEKILDSSWYLVYAECLHCYMKLTKSKIRKEIRDPVQHTFVC